MRSTHAALSLVILLSISLLAITGSNAYAYLDAGSGSYLFQLAVASAVGSIVALRHHWGKLTRWLRLTRREDEQD